MFSDINKEESELIKNNNMFAKYFLENKLNSEIIRDRTILLDGDFNFWKWTELGPARKYYNSKKYSDVEKRTIVGHFGEPKGALHRDSHFSLHGHNVVANSIIEYIEKNKLFKND